LETRGSDDAPGSSGEGQRDTPVPKKNPYVLISPLQSSIKMKLRRHSVSTLKVKQVAKIAQQKLVNKKVKRAIQKHRQKK